jgi:hypothetical protein
MVFVMMLLHIQALVEGSPYCSVLNTMTGQSKVSKLKGSEAAVVDYVAAISTGAKDPLQKVLFLSLSFASPSKGKKLLLRSPTDVFPAVFFFQQNFAIFQQRNWEKNWKLLFSSVNSTNFANIV